MKSNTPTLRFPQFSGKWERMKLGDICEYKNGGSFENSIVDQGKYNLITLNSIDIDGKIKTEHKTVNHADWVLAKDDLIMVLSDIAHGNFLGLVDIIPENDKYVLNQRMGLLRKTDDNVDLRLLRAYINLKQRYFKLHGQGSSQQNLSKGDILRFQVVLPLLDEQQKIASFLTAVDERIMAVQKKVGLLKKYKKGVMQKIFSQEIRFKDENGKEFPEWKEERLGDLAAITTGKKDVNAGNPNGKYRFYTCARDFTYSDSYSFEGEAVLIAGNADVGLCHYYDGKFEAYQRTYVLQNFKVYGSYLYRYLSHYFRQYALSLKQTSAMSFIKIDMLDKFNVPVPSKEEQQKIAEFLTAIDDKIAQEERRLAEAKRFKKSLLQQMFV